ncbi:UNVERIFIED_CONTAM: Vacuolar protein sorting-associated protein 53 A [Sesamum radiatum]|uniref:Vacuolar protein sorting-associated protein 53 A n=1 Tax=Sesamum radiatum TaxID=300843 RepID=A0AAW2ND07_SESRA
MSFPEYGLTPTFQAVNQLCSHFDAYRDNPKITELKDRFKSIKRILKSHVFSDFSSLGTGKETEEANYLQQLSDACLLVDALEPSVREDSVKNFCSRELTSYQQIFEGAELAKLDKTERRYAWIKRRLRTNEEIWKIFPPSWHVPYLLCIQFCKLTRTQLEETLSNLNEKPDVGTLLLEQNDHKDLSVPGAGFNFRGIISSCFEPYLMVYVELEEKTLMEHLEKLVQEETWDVEDGSQTNILSSSIQVFERILKAYATKLFGRLPKGGTGIVAAATGMDGQIKDEFSAVITKALITLVHGIETKFDTEMVAMTRVPWGTLESVGDQSAYVNGINTILTASIPVLEAFFQLYIFSSFLTSTHTSIFAACIKSWSSLFPQYIQMQAHIGNRSTTNVIGYTSCKNNSSGYSFPWKTGMLAPLLDCRN